MTPPAHCAGAMAAMPTESSTEIFVQTLGKAQIDLTSGQLTPASSRKFSLLLRLAADAGGRIPRTTLHELIYPDLPEANARHSLRDLVYQLRQGGVRLSSDSDGIALCADAVDSDVRRLLDQDRPDAAQLRAIEGGFLPGYTPTHSQALSEWYDGYRAKTVFELCKLLLREVQRAKSAGDWAATERAARACLALDPLNEVATIALAEVLAIAGSKMQAVRLLDTYIAECAGAPHDLTMTVKALRRRIGERLPDRYQAGPELPFLGREPEMRTLIEAFERATHERNQCVVVHGEPGIGKSRLVSEFQRYVTLKGAHVHVVRSAPTDLHHPLAAFSALVPRLRQLPGALGCEPASLVQLDRLAPEPTSAPPSMSGEDAFFALAYAIGDLVDAIASEQPLVLVFEDVHWIDHTSRQLLGNLAAGNQKSRVMLILTTRDVGGLLDDFKYADNTFVSHLRGLESSAGGQLAAAALSVTSAAHAEVRDWIVRTSSGNPLFISTLALHFLATGAAFVVPDSLTGLIGKRLERLGHQTFAVLQIATILGKNCSVERLASAAGLPHATFLAVLAELNATGMLERGGASSDITLHALIGDAVLQRASAAALAASHAHIAALLEAETEHAPDTALLWDAAEHWLGAQRHERAADAFRRCAKQLLTMGRPRDAAELLCRAAERIGTGFDRELALEGAHIAAEAREHDIVLQATELLRRFGWTPGHDALELAELVARVVWLNDDAAAHARLVSCINQPEMPEHRREAAHEMLRSAAHNLDKSAADLAYSVLTESVKREDSREEASELATSLFYHVPFGDLDFVESRIPAFLSCAGGLPLRQASEIRRRAAVMYWFTGHPDEALAGWMSEFEDVKQLGLIRAQFDTALMLATTNADLGNVAAAEAWLLVATEFADAVPALRGTIEFLAHRMDAAAARQDFEELAACGQACSQLSDQITNRLCRRLIAALRTLTDVLAGKQYCVDEVVSRMTAHHGVNTEIANASDFEVATAIRACLKAGDIATARRVRDRYLNECRRVRSPVWSSLRECLTELVQLAPPEYPN
jgi:DNA-binding SARP family transcriptional activator